MRKTGRVKQQLSPTAALLKNSAIGAAVGLVCCILFSFIAAFVIAQSDLPHRSIMPIAMAIIGLSSFIGGIVAGKLHHRQGLVLGVLVGAITFAVIFISGLFVPDENIGTTLPLKAALSLLPSVVGTVLGVNMRRKY
ncbi:MAG: TIGR04086 family membrane protein [Oscillospiraceae bacterium]|nr:TIGR04086 family membrane protein [Oscillospiraceae bacterium]